MDRSDSLDGAVALLRENPIRFCVVGVQAVNACGEPVVSIVLDLAVAVDDMPRVESLLREEFAVTESPQSLNTTAPGSDEILERLF